MKDLMATWINVLDHIPQYFSFNTGEFVDQALNKNRIINFLTLEEAPIRAKLNQCYTTLSKLEYQEPLTYCLTQNTNLDFAFQIQYITTHSLLSKVYKFVFTSNDDFIVSPDGEPDVSSNTGQDTALTCITIKKEIWTGYTFTMGDTFYLSLTHYEPLLVYLSSKLGAAKLLEQTFASQTSNTSSDAALLRQEVRLELNRLVNLDGESRLEVPWNPIDNSIVNSNYFIDDYGQDADSADPRRRANGFLDI